MKVGSDILLLDYDFEIDFLTNKLEYIDTLNIEGIEYFTNNEA